MNTPNLLAQQQKADQEQVAPSPTRIKIHPSVFPYLSYLEAIAFLFRMVFVFMGAQWLALRLLRDASVSTEYWLVVGLLLFLYFVLSIGQFTFNYLRRKKQNP